MGPSRCTRSSSRQSSILKPSKPRQPLQNLNFNSSSNENSPTVTAKIKRRVSFAEKKHVKEFCNSLEDGTVWNNTYEEQDLSNHKTCNCNEKDPVVENVCKENVFNNTQENDVQCDCNELIEKDLNVEDYSSHVTNVTEDVNDQDEVLLIESSVTLHDVAAEESEAICSIDLQSKNNSRVSQSIIVYEDADEKLHEQLPQLSNSNAQNFYCDKLNDTSPQHTSMEFTTAISSVTKPDDNINDPEIAVSFIDDEKVDNVSMEMTMAIPTALSNLQDANFNGISLCTRNLLLQDNDNRTILFHDLSMDVTKAVTDIHKPFDRSMAIQKPQQCKYDITSQEERTKLLNISMEMTTAIPVNVHSMTKNQERDATNHASTENNYKILRYDSEAYEISANIDRTRICNDDAMEFTTAITSLPKTLPHNLPQEMLMKNTSYIQPTPLNSILDRCRNEDLQSNGTTIFHDNSMTMTKVVSSLNIRDRVVEVEDPELDANNQESGKTVLFQNTSMEMTEAVPMIQIPVRPNISMEMTEAVPMMQTPVRSNVSMEITEAVPIIQTLARSNVSMEMTEAVPMIQIPARSNVSMEMTEAVPMTQIPARSNLSMEETEAVPIIQTPARSNVSMEMTEAVPIIQTLARSNVSMEMTEAVPMIQIPARSNVSMEMTEAVPMTQIPARSNLSMEETEAVPIIQTPAGSNASMEMTEAVPMIQIPARSNLSMEVTEAVPMIQIPAGSNVSMEMAEAVPMTQILARSNVSMEMTEAVPMIQIPARSNISTEIPESAPISQISAELNTSMEIVEPVIVSQAPAQANISVETTEGVAVQQTSVQLNASMEITEAVVISQTSQVGSLNKNSVKDRKSVLLNSENFGNRDLVDLSTQADNTLKDTIVTLIPPLLQSDIISGNEDSNVHNSPKNLDDNGTIATFTSKISKLANVKPSMALHELNQQDSASALQENNMGTACATFNSVLNNSPSAVNSELSKNEHLPNRETQTTSHLRRTYTIQPLSNDRTFTADTNEANNILESNNDTLHCTLNDKENSVLISNSLQNSEWNESLEQIDSIKPPEFMCLDDLSIADLEVNTETSRFSKNVNNEHEDTSKMSDPHANELEKLRKSQTFLIKRASVSDADGSRFEVEDRIHADEMQKVQLLDAKDANTDIQVWECSSSTIDETEPKKDPPNLPAENCNLEDQVMECSSSNVKVNDRSNIRGEDNDKLIDTPMVEVENEHHSEEKSRLSLQPPSSWVQENNSVELDPFLLLMNELKVCAKSDHIIWEVYHENIERHLFVIGFISNSLLVAIYLRDPCDITNDQFIREIKMISCLADDAEALISIVHRIILEKLDTKKLLDSYKDREDILPMLNYISMEVKLAMDFMFDVRRLNDINLMEITRDSVSFVSRTNRRKILLNVTIEIKPFDKIESRNISVHCLLGSVREEDVKKLITNIKRDHKFLRRYINDVKDYIYLMEQ